MNTRLIVRYLAGECIRAEEVEVEQWIKSDPQNENFMRELRQIWDASGKENKDFNEIFDPREDWEVFQHRMKQDSEKREGTHPSFFQLNNSQLKISNRRFALFLRVAAIILFASLIGIVTYQNIDLKHQGIAEPVLREIAMEKGQRGTLTLSDGTKVILNAESKIILPNEFRADKREITLEGQAFFDVSHNPDRPFVIRTDNAIVQVLGTSLDVRSYSEDRAVQVVVKEGLVSLKSNNGGVDDYAILGAGERGQLSECDNQITKNKVDDLDLFFSWTQGYLKFKDTPMNKVADELERKYDIEINFADSDLKDLRLTAELLSRTIQYNLDVISTSLDMEYKIDQQVITFLKSNKKE